MKFISTDWPHPNPDSLNHTMLLHAIFTASAKLKNNGSKKDKNSYFPKYNPRFIFFLVVSITFNKISKACHFVVT